MKIYYQVNNLEKKTSLFYDSNKKPIPESSLPPTVKKVAMGFPSAVLFDPPLKGKIYAYVIDNAGRKQYFYTKDYKEEKEEEKYKKFPKIIDRVDKLIGDCKKNNDEVSLAVLLMNECNFRIGHEKYKKLYGTNGTLTLNASHMTKKSNGIEIEFVGKKKEINYCLVKKNSFLYPILEKFSEKSKAPLFKDIKYDDVYDFLKEYKVRPKDIRQVSANRAFYEFIQKKSYNGDDKKSSKQYLKDILDLTSQKMNHTATVCKNEYLMPQWFLFDDANKLKRYINNHNFQQTIKYISNIDL